ncbi:MAG: NUDIX domain-containing protein [Bacteroidales bacterium]|nr:NUDIX domain-containing protein [Bacteroidales bacterium]
MSKVYLNKSFIVISGQPDREQKYCLLHKYHSKDELYTKISSFIENDEFCSLNIYSGKINSLWQDFRSYFENRTAAGGLLVNNNEKLLFIRRRGVWDLPKGHLSENEAPEEGARREIEEETGLSPGKRLSILKPTYHIYPLDDKWILKETNWYIFDYSGEGKALPQVEEYITEVRWFGRDETEEVLKNTWPSISDVINEALIHF